MSDMGSLNQGVWYLWEWRLLWLLHDLGHLFLSQAWTLYHLLVPEHSLQPKLCAVPGL